ncbi:unnamed protein product, partial [Rotaria sp. Silwood1]
RARKSDEDPDDGKILEEQQSDNTSTSEVDKKYQYFIGKDYSNAYQRDFTELEDYTTDSVARTLVPRMPWHDEALVVFGQTARDVARHFIQRWNIHKEVTRKTRKYFSNFNVEFFFLKCETYLKNDSYPFLLPKSYDDVEDLAVENWSDFLESEPFRENAQNQFFITIAQDSVVRNQLANVLFRRIERAHNNAEKFRI